MQILDKVGLSHLISIMKNELSNKVGKDDVVLSMTKDELLSAMYPIGAVYISTSETNPASLFGGTWEQIQDTFLLAAGSTYAGGSTGGEATHKLTIAEMPSHNHSSKGWAAVTDYSGEYLTLGAAGQSNNYTTNNTGGGQAHNNMPPYLAVYVYKRIG